ncbi:hypothetical protein ACFL6M_06705, partial [Candidatus Eisenbacteria bacterium]
MNPRILRVCVVFVGLLVASWITATAATYVVNPEGTGDYPTIQAAIDACVDGDIVELTDGTYTGDGNRDIAFLGKPITVRSQSGNPEVCIINCEGSGESPHRGFEFRAGEGPGSVLEDLTITGGVADSVESFGGAVFCHSASPTIVGCIFSENVAFMGGGMYCSMCSSSISDCAFIQNTARNGGGLWSHGSP